MDKKMKKQSTTRGNIPSFTIVEVQNGRKKRPSLLSGALRKPDPRPKNTTPEDEIKTLHNYSCPPPSISAKTRIGPVLGQWDCADWSLLCEFVWKCKSIGLPIHPLGVSEILCPLVTWHCQASSHPEVLTLLNKSWTKLSGDSQRRLRTAEPLFDERELEFRANDKSDNPTSGASPILSGLRGGLYPFDWRCRTLSRLFLSRILGSPCLNISRLTWRGSCNVIEAGQF